MSPYRCPPRRMRVSSARRSVRQIVRYTLTFLAALLLALGATPLAFLGQAATAYAQGAGTLTVRMFEDVGRDGVDSGGEPALVGRFVTVYSSDDRVVNQLFTDANGLAVFPTLPLGQYRVEVSRPTGYVVSVPGSAAPGTVRPNPGLVFRVALTAPAPSATFAVGFRPVVGGVDSAAPAGTRSLDTRIWDDRDADGIQDADEPGLAGLTVQLLSGGTPVLTATEVPDLAGASGGRYLFETAPVSLTYTVRVVSGLPAGYSLTQPNVSLNTLDQRDSDATLGALPNYEFTLLPALRGANEDSLDIGFARAAVSGYLFRDADRNGLFDLAAGDERLDGVTVELLDAADTPVLTTTTRTEFGNNAESGVFRFPGLVTGTYSVRVPGLAFESGAALFGAANSPTAAGGDQGEPDGIVDSAAGVQTAPFTLDFSNVAAGSNARNSEHFGFFKGAVGDFVWFDLDRDGQQTGEEDLGVDGVRVFVDDDNDGIRDTTEISAVTDLDLISDVNGAYLFNDLALGRAYTITLDAENFLPGALLEGIAAGNAASATNGLGQTYYYTVTDVLTTTTPNDLSVDFGLTRSDIGNFVFVDADGNGLFDPGEEPIPGVTVELRRAGTDAVVTSTLTGPTGVYTIPNVPAFGYYAIFDLATAGPTYADFIGSPSITTTVDPAETVAGDFTDLITPALDLTRWRTAVFTPTAGVVNNGVDAGFYQPTSLSGRAFFDTDGDELDSAAPEPGVRGVEVRLLRAADTSVVTTTTTALDDTAVYTFTDVAPGPYLIEFVNPVTSTFALITGTTAITTSNPLGSDVETIVGAGDAGRTGTVNVTSGAPLDELDAGFTGRGLLAGRVFRDVDGSDTQTVADENLPGATAALTVTADLPNLVASYSAVVTPTLTDAADPNYSFVDLPFGTGVTYTLAISPPVTTPPERPYLPSEANVGGDDALDSDGPTLVISETGALVEVDQGFYQEALVTARVFEEVENNPTLIDNRFDPADDQGVENVTVGIEAITGTLTLTATTDATGVVSFTVKPGSYRLNLDETDPQLGVLLPSPGHTDPVTITGDPVTSNGASLTDDAGANSFGFYNPAFVTGQVFFDRDLDSLKSGEPGVGGVEVALTGPSGTLTATTNLSGVYTVTGLLPGDYTATFTNPDPGNFAFITGGDSDVISAGPVVSSSTFTDTVTVVYSGITTEVDAGLVGRSSVGGRTFFDNDANGSSEGDLEPGLPFVTVTLTLNVDIPGVLTTELTRTTETTFTAPLSDSFRFTGLPGATGGGTSAYTLTFIPLPNAVPPLQPTTPDAPGVPEDSNSDGDLANQPLAPTTDDERDQGFFQDVIITALVFAETTAPVDNDFVTGDQGIEGVDVRLETITGTLVLTATTDPDGEVFFVARPGVDYRLSIDAASAALADLTPSPGFTNPLTVTGNTLFSGDTSFADAVPGANSFGFFQSGDVSGTVFFDRDEDGLLAGEPGVGGVQVTLSDGTSTFTTTTDATGVYSFTGLVSNTYTLTISNPDAGNFAFVTGGDSVVDAGGTASVNVAGGASVGDQDAGLVGLSAVGGRTFEDENANGSSEGDTDPALPGVTVTLTLDVSLPGLTTQITRTAVTTGTGVYSFTGLPGATTYDLGFTPPDATPPWQLTEADAAGVPEDSDSDGALTGQTLDPATTDERDQGYFQDATITALVFEETASPIDNDFEAGDSGLAGVSVSLETITGTLVLSGTTDATGVVTFTARPGVDYQLNLDESDAQLAGLNPSLPNFTNPVTVTGNTLLSGEVSLADTEPGDNSFGFFQSGDLSGTVYFDRDEDGLLAGEPGVGGVQITLSDGTSTFTTTTDATGVYSFTGLISATYTLTVSNPDAGNFAFVTGGDSVVDAGGTASVAVGYSASVGGQDAGLVGLSAVGGRTFEDLDANGSSEGDTDPALPGVTVTLTLDVSLPGLTTQITRTAVTTGTGVYSFTGLPGATTYDLGFTPPDATPPWQLTEADAAGVPEDSDSDGELTGQTLAPATADERDQGYFQDATVTARVFEELAGAADNSFAVGDSGVLSVTVNLEPLGGGAAVATGTSDATGLVTFTVRPGTYQLNVDEGAAALVGLSPSPGHTDPVTITTTPAGGQLLSGESSLTDGAGANSFGYFRTATISGTAFFDRDLDTRKPTDPGVEGVEVALVQGATVVSTTTTTATGAYTFTGVVSNSYTLVFTNPDTANFSFFTTGDSLVTTGGPVLTSTIDLGTVAFGASVADRDAGFQGLAAVGGRAFVDLNADGDSEADTDPGLSGVTVTLTLDVSIPGTLTTQITRTALTPTGTGVYSFTGLPGGGATTFDLSFNPPDATWTLTAAEQGGDEDYDSDDELTDQPLAPGEQAERDQGFFQAGTIVARVFDERVTINNSFEPGEVGIAGVTVAISPAAISNSGPSDATGLITFTVRPGTYTLSRPDLLAQSFTPSPTNTATVDVTATSGIASQAFFGFYRPNILQGTAWFDSSRDGLLDLGEPGMEGITVTLQAGTGGPILDQAVTTITGTYTLTDVQPSGLGGAPADYRLCFSSTADFTFTLKGGTAGADNDSDANPDGCTDPFTVVSSNSTITTTDAGYLGVYSIGDLAWDDADSNGLQDAGEDGLAGAVVTLAISTTGGLINSTDPTVTMTATSTASVNLGANYAVTGVPPASGFTVVSVAPPVGFALTLANQGADDTLDSDAPGDSFGAVPPDVVDLDFGFVALTTVGDLVWLDLNGNGLYDAASEAGAPGVRVELLSGTSVVSSTITGIGAQAGLYAFADIAPGTYSLRFIAPSGYVFTNNGAGSVTTDGDNDARSDGTTVPFTLVGGQQLLSVDAGLRGVGSIGGLVWLDANRNNVRDPTDTGRVEGVQVTLTLTPTMTPGRLLQASTTSAADGTYSFANLPEGTATVSFVQPAGLFPVTPNVGSDTLDSDGPVATLNLPPNGRVTTLDMGYRERGLLVFLPMLSGRTARADLTGSLTVTPATPQGYAPVEVAVTVTNNGDAPASNFWVDLYINPLRTPTVNDRWNDICGTTLPTCTGIAWFYTDTLNPGQSVTLVSTATDETNPNGYVRAASIWPGYFANGTSRLYVYVDSWNRDETGAVRDPNGAVGEQNEGNNLVERAITVTPGTPPGVQTTTLTTNLVNRATLRR